jgi:hypothetical protein
MSRWEGFMVFLVTPHSSRAVESDTGRYLKVLFVTPFS